MKCKNCGAEIDGNFCPNCGISLSLQEEMNEKDFLKKEKDSETEQKKKYTFLSKKIISKSEKQYEAELGNNILKVSPVSKKQGCIGEIEIENIQSINMCTMLAPVAILAFFIIVLCLSFIDLHLAGYLLIYIIYWAIVIIGGFVNKKVEIASSKGSVIFYSNSGKKVKKFIEDIKCDINFKGNIHKYISKLHTGLLILIGICMIVSMIKTSNNDNEKLSYIQNYELMEDSITLKQILEYHWKGGKWSSFVGGDEFERATRVVQYKLDEKNIIQFQLENDSIKNKELGNVYLVIEGNQIKEADDINEALDEMYYDYSLSKKSQSQEPKNQESKNPESQNPETDTAISQKEGVVTVPITFVNNIGVDIYSLYASAADTNNWEEDILELDILEYLSAFQVDFTYETSQTKWDFAIKDSEGNMIEFYDMDFNDYDSSGATIILNGDGTADIFEGSSGWENILQEILNEEYRLLAGTYSKAEDTPQSEFPDSMDIEIYDSPNGNVIGFILSESISEGGNHYNTDWYGDLIYENGEYYSIDADGRRAVLDVYWYGDLYTIDFYIDGVLYKTYYKDA